jgi:hypothetical protein
MGSLGPVQTAHIERAFATQLTRTGAFLLAACKFDQVVLTPESMTMVGNERLSEVYQF